MFSHITVGTNNFARAAAFYDTVLATLGHQRFVSGDYHAGYGLPNGNQFWLLRPFDKAAATPGNGNHIALLAPSRNAVRTFHATALANGGSDEGVPALRPHYHANYYGAYARDPDGNKIQAVCHRSE
jgi:catechol 2,3-dioxygenase-like lactoylglutathione lyase family enzyme|tara:strand:- start:13 stop:393 length:381 start_codon:yes stop_codon:yes gene_type:complete